MELYDFDQLLVDGRWGVLVDIVASFEGGAEILNLVGKFALEQIAIISELR